MEIMALMHSLLVTASVLPRVSQDLVFGFCFQKCGNTLQKIEGDSKIAHNPTYLDT